MPLLQHVEPGGEIYLPFAKRKLGMWKQQLSAVGVRSWARTIFADTGTVIYINSVQLGDGLYRDRIRITSGGTINYAQLMIGASFVVEGGVTGDPARGTAAGVETTTVTFSGPGGTYSVVGTATGAGSVIEYNRWAAQSGLLYFQYGVGSFLSGITGSSSEEFFYDASECIAAAGLDFTTAELTTLWPAYLSALTFLAGLAAPATRYHAYLPDHPSPIVAGFVPDAGSVARITVYASEGNGNSFGMFGPTAGRTSVRVLGTASFSYDRTAQEYTFRSWSPTSDGVLSVLPPANIPAANAIVSWTGAATDSFAPAVSVTAEDTTFAAAVLAAR